MRVRYHGITDEQTTCDHCGRAGLKKTVMLFILDADGNADELTYYGISCAATALNTTAARVRRDAKTAERGRRESVARLTRILGEPDITGRTLHEVRRMWNTNVRTRPDGTMYGSVTVAGVEYGPHGGPERGFRAFAAAQEAEFRRELDALV